MGTLRADKRLEVDGIDAEYGGIKTAKHSPPLFGNLCLVEDW